ncbi:MAG TPA: hypothetical protein VEW05_06620 [Candidatus Polarisedimenticolia bacterium]|nr:hypothetical protein [Candidatus Polarisedimenticolia bacterium]
MKNYLLFVVVLIAVGLIGFTLGEKIQFTSSRVSFNEPAPMGMGVIQGIVTEGAVTLVDAQPPSPASEIVVLADASGTTILQATVTDGQGRFRFLVQSGQYLLGMSFGRSGMQIRNFTKVDMSSLENKNITLTTMNP